MATAADTAPADRRPTSMRHYVLAALLVITAISYVQRNCISPALTSIEEDESVQITASQLDLAVSAFFLFYGLLQVPSGWLAQRWGARLVLALYAAGWSLALIGSALAVGPVSLCTGRLSMGILQAGIFPCCTLVLAVWYPTGQRALASALLNSFMLAGGAGGVMLAGKLLEPLGWRGVFFAYGLPGIVWAVWFAWWFRNHPSEHPRVNQAELALLPTDRPGETPAAGRQKVPWAVIFTSVPLLLLCAQQACRAGANRLFDSRLPTYLERERQVSKADAAWLSSFPQWSGVLGGIIGGALSDYVLRQTGRRRWARNGIAIFSLLSATVVYGSAYFVANVTLAVLVLSVGAFLFTFSSPCSYALSMDIGGKHLAVVFGLFNMVGNLGATAFTSSIMFMEGLGGWELVLGVWLGLHLLAAVFWFFLSPEGVIGEGHRSE